MNKKTKVSSFTRIMVVVVIGLITTLIISDFFWFDPKGNITNGIIILFGFLLLLALAEIFDNLTLGKFISLKKNYIEKKEEIQILKKDNNVLLNQVIQITSNLSQMQSQSNTTVVGGMNDKIIETLLQNIIPAKKEEIEEKEKQEEVVANITSIDSIIKKKVDWKNLEQDVLNNWLESRSISKDKVKLDVKLSSSKHNIDPISNYQVIFDAYLPDYDMFIEIRQNNYYSTIVRDRIYTMLSKLLYYKAAVNKPRVMLLLLLVEYEDGRNNIKKLEEMITIEFQPAIELGLLDIQVEKYSDEEMIEFYK